MESLKKNRLPVLASHSECTGCMACVETCPVNAISSYWGDDGHQYVEVNEKKCIKCHKCERVCKKSRDNYGTNEINESAIYAAWAEHLEDRIHATSGGVFAAIANNIISKGGCVVGAALDGFECHHKIIEHAYEIKDLQGSKYMYSSLNGIYNLIEEQLKERDVLFSGLGCQCAGILAYFDGKSFPNKLFTIDLVCGGAPSRLLISKFIENNENIESIISFRDKEKYVLRVKEAGENIELKNKNLPLHGFNCGMTNRYSCYHCQFAKIHRRTNLTIGDLWSKNLIAKQQDQGISMVICHDIFGKQLLDTSDIMLNEIEWEKPILANKRLVCGKQHLFFTRKHLVFLSKHLPYEVFRRLYCMDIGIKNPVLFTFRLYRFVVQKIEIKRNLKYIKSLLTN